MQRRLVALVGQCGVSLRHVLEGQAVVAEHGERVGTIQRRIVNAGLPCGFGDFLRAELGLQIHVHGVRGLFRRRVQVHVSQILAAVVAHRFGDARERPVRVAVEVRVEADAFVDGGQQCERLHGGADFVRCLGDVVELLGQVVVSCVQRDDGTVLGVHRQRAELHAVGHDALHAVLGGTDGGEHQVLLRFVNGGDDFVAAGFQVLLAERLGVDEFVLHHRQQVSVRSGHLVVLLDFDGLREFRGFLLVRRDVAVFVHDVQHALVTFFSLLGIHVGGPYARRGNDAGKHGRFGERQILRVLAEVRFGRCLDAVCATAEIDGVHVVAQHLALVLCLGDFDRQERLTQFAHVRGGFAQIIAFRILLGDGGTALPATGGQVVVERACDADRIDALIGIEGAVFRSHNRVADVVGQVCAADDFAVLLRIAADRRGAVVVVHGRLFGQRELFRLRDFRGGVHVGEQADTCRDERREDAEHPFEHEMLVFSGLFGCAMRSVLRSLGRLAQHFSMDPVGGAHPWRRGRCAAAAGAF